MDGKTVSKITDLTYGQVNYLVDNIDGLLSKPSVSQGKAREFAFSDVVLLRLIYYLKNDGYRIKHFRRAVDVVRANWKDETPGNAGYLFTGWMMGGLYGIKTDEFRWAAYTPIQLVTKDGITDFSVLFNIPSLYYNLKKIANSCANIIQVDGVTWPDI